MRLIVTIFIALNAVVLCAARMPVLAGLAVLCGLALLAGRK